jgi:DNA-binding transcriptional MocR family regulator
MTQIWKPTIQKSDEPLYQILIRVLGDDISKGVLPADTRLPTQRELADGLKIAIGTVTRAYSEAERRGLIRSEGRRGTFVGPSHRGRSTLAELTKAGKDAIDLSHNTPPYEVDPDLSLALRAIARSQYAQELLRYPNPAGLERHRIAGARWLETLGYRVDPDCVLVTMGAQHAILIALASLAEPNDILVSESLTYPGVVAAAEMVGLQTMSVASDECGMIPESLESVCKQHRVRAIYANPTLQNPTNITWPESRRKEIAAIAEKYDVLILEDELFRPLHPSPPPPISIYAPERSCIVVSVSKTIAAGLRVGFIAVPHTIRTRITERLQISLLAAPPLTTEIIANWINDGSADRIISQRRDELDYRQNMAAEILGAWDISTASASCSFWLKLPESWSGLEFAMEAQRRGVAISPAEVFALDRKTATNAVRISVGTAPNRETLKKGLKIIAGILGGQQHQEKLMV